MLKIAKLTERYSVPILVLANKQDLPLSQDLVKLEKCLGLKDLGRNVGWAVKSCCAVTGEGLEEAFTNLEELIVKKKRTGSRPPSANKGRLHKKVQRYLRRANSGVSQYPSYQKIFELTENFCQNYYCLS